MSPASTGELGGGGSTPDADYSPKGRLALVQIGDRPLSRELTRAVTTGNLDLSTDEVSQLTLTFQDDYDFRLLRASKLQAGTPTDPGSKLRYADLPLEVRALAIDNGPIITVTARPWGVGKLRREKGGQVWRDLSPTDWARAAARRAGMDFIGQPTDKRNQIVRKAKKSGEAAESSWDVFQRLGSEEGYLACEVSNVLIFAHPTWLVTNATERLTIEWRGQRTDGRVIDVPSCRRSGDDPGKFAGIDLTLLGHAGEDVRPCNAADLSGLPTFDGSYLVTKVTLDVASNNPVTVSVETPINPKPEPRGGLGGSGASSSSYVNPIGKGLKVGRIDEGVDFTGAGPLYALGDGAIKEVSGSGWPGGVYILLALNDGNYVYYAENITPAVTVGQHVKAGDLIGHAHDAYPYIEIGWATATPQTPLAHGHYREGVPTPEGRDFAALLGTFGIHVPGAADHSTIAPKKPAGGSGSGFGSSVNRKGLPSGPDHGGVNAIAELCYNVGFRGKALIDMVAIGGAESGWNATADNGIAAGWSQINYHEHPYSAAELKDAAVATKAAWEVSSHGRNFGPWNVYDSPPATPNPSAGRYRDFLGEAERAVRKVIGGPGHRRRT